MHMLAHAHAPQHHRGRRVGKGVGHFAQGGHIDATNGRHALGGEGLHMQSQGFKVAGALAHKGLVRPALGDDDVQQGVEQRHIGVGLERQMAPGVAGQISAARVHQHQARAPLHRIFDPGGRHRVVGAGVGANHHDQLGLGHIAHRVAHRPRAHPFEQCGHAGGVAQAGAVVDVVAAKTGAHQFLKQISFFIAALGRTKSGQTLGPVLLAQAHQTLSRQIQSFVPSGGSENLGPTRRLAVEVQRLGHTRFAHQGGGQAVWVVCVIETKTAFDTQALLVGGACTALHFDDALVFHMVGEQATHATKRTHRIDLAVHLLVAQLRLGAERAGGTGLHAFTTSHASAFAHGIGQVKHDARFSAPPLHPNDLVDLHLATGTHTTVALDTRRQIDRHRGVRIIAPCHALCVVRVPAAQILQGRPNAHPHLTRPLAEFAMGQVGFSVNPLHAAVGSVGQQQLHHQGAAFLRPFAVGVHDHAGRRCATATGCQSALALDFDHTGAAVAIWPVTRLVAQMRNLYALALGHLPQGFAGLGVYRQAVEVESNRLAHAASSGLAPTSCGKYFSTH